MDAFDDCWGSRGEGSITYRSPLYPPWRATEVPIGVTVAIATTLRCGIVDPGVRRTAGAGGDAAERRTGRA